MIYLFIFMASLFLTYLIRTYALKKSLLATVNERSSHTTPTPHGGGIAIAVTWFLGLVYLFTCKEIEPTLFYALLCGSLLSVVSYFDDLYELSPKLRLLVQAGVSVAGLYVLGGLEQIDFGFWMIENPLITNVLAFLGIMWFINLYNFLDGIDGYAGSEAIFLAIAGWLLFGGDHFLILVASVAGFLVWNWHRAKIFMGDVGSTLLGYTVAIFALYYQNSGFSIFIWIILFGLFWFDATLTLIRRYKNHEKLSQAHRKHAYQRLVQSGILHDRVVFFALGINLVLLILGYSAFTQPSNAMGYFMVAILVLYGAVKMVDKRKKFE
ncbi:MraY family glycosyltransferase [Sulfurospirillum multivorans]|uniref:Undecaprenyl-phosphate N-acetylglucosaminyl 1-phosphate transferase n=2 Tax=Sulfurospirillum multivorans TaxID=66821 RepID=A0AA86AN53_SULMK|nr:glycosyltransferase family 4 protein [Sulfurospirillum multivorans]AHJ13711.1 putative undecaprenyl-phosphate N-acetylglucosaminyl 1-phosphate transferase [Sulfurospirillum multivorans DSM 12446]QEH07201.1 putative undecaprenyl-phosphate N-acetylglucosaminyl 1-phosphate transferase [Sulfurospirillum multivorans]